MDAEDEARTSHVDRATENGNGPFGGELRYRNRSVMLSSAKVAVPGDLFTEDLGLGSITLTSTWFEDSSNSAWLACFLSFSPHSMLSISLVECYPEECTAVLSSHAAAVLGIEVSEALVEETEW